MRQEAVQYGLSFDPAPEQEFAAWKQLPGSGQVLRQVYRFAAPYGRRFMRTGRRVSVKLIWELTRDHVKAVRKRAKRKGVTLSEWKGYALNNSFTAAMARHIEDRRPEWAGMFEKRAVGEKRSARPIYVDRRPIAKQRRTA